MSVELVVLHKMNMFLPLHEALERLVLIRRNIVWTDDHHFGVLGTANVNAMEFHLVADHRVLRAFGGHGIDRVVFILQPTIVANFPVFSIFVVCNVRVLVLRE